MTIAQLRHVFTAVILCMPAHAITNSFITDTASCSPFIQRVCLFLRGASLAAPCAASTAGGCNISGSSKGHGSKDLQKSRFGALYTEHGNKVIINEREVQRMEEQRRYEAKRRKEMKRLEREISKWHESQKKKKKA